MAFSIASMHCFYQNENNQSINQFQEEKITTNRNMSRRSCIPWGIKRRSLHNVSLGFFFVYEDNLFSILLASLVKQTRKSIRKKKSFLSYKTFAWFRISLVNLVCLEPEKTVAMETWRHTLVLLLARLLHPPVEGRETCRAVSFLDQRVVSLLDNHPPPNDHAQTGGLSVPPVSPCLYFYLFNYIFYMNVLICFFFVKLNRDRAST